MTNCSEPRLKQLPDILTIQRQSLISRYMNQSKGIMHLGAHVGQEREKYSHLGKRVLWVEGHPEIFLKLQQKKPTFLSNAHFVQSWLTWMGSSPLFLDLITLTV